MRFLHLSLFAATSVPMLLIGCHSAFIEATVSNRSAENLSLVEVDYPSASFGTQNLAAGQDFRYRFKVLGSGIATVQWTDSLRREHKSSGPMLHESDEGKLTITFSETGPAWNLSYAPHP